MKVYVVKFPCPTRGFFGVYLEAIRCIDYAVSNQIPFYVDLSESNSLYTDAERFNGNTNVWDYYYQQEKPVGNVFQYSVTRYEGNIDKIWKRSHFRRVYKRAVQHLSYSKPVQQLLDTRKKDFPSSVIGVHIRKTDHSLEVPAIAFETYISVLQENIQKKGYKHIFLATDDTYVVDTIKKLFPQQVVICNTVTRSDDGKPVHKNEAFENRFMLGAEAILDAYSLSLCNEVILTNSNLSYCALYMNPELNYILLDGFKTGRLRLFLRNIFFEMRYALFHTAFFIDLHRKWRYLLKRL